MGNRDDLYQLTEMVEFDEGYFGKEVPEQTRSKLKRGRGSERQINVAVMAESIPVEDLESGKISNHCRHFKMKVLDSHKSTEIESLIKNSLDPEAVVFSDKSTSYFNIENYVESHISKKSNKQTTVDMLKWVHIAISNAKRNFLGVYHKINGRYLQNYLDEFVYKLNRRYFKSIFERLVVASVYPYWQPNE